MSRIVVADDHSFLRAGVEALLRGVGHEIVASVGDGAAALDAVRDTDPDVVILDVRMPVLNGVAALEAIRAAGDERPVILLTAELDDASLVKAMKCKVNGIVFKDAQESNLENAVRAVLAGELFIDPNLLYEAATKAAATTPTPGLPDLGKRERLIVEAVMTGKRNREIAEMFGVSEGSIKLSLFRAYRKLRVSNRTELILRIQQQQP